MDTDSYNIYDDDRNILNLDKKIVIVNNVWIGCRCLILKGTIVPNNCIVGANTMLNRKFDEENTIIAGIEANVKRKNISWK